MTDIDLSPNEGWEKAHKNIVQEIEEKYPELEEVVLFDNLAEAYVGLAFGGSFPRALYDFPKIIEVYEKSGMTEIEAIEFFEYNPMRTAQYFGEKGPMFTNME